MTAKQSEEQPENINMGNWIQLVRDVVDEHPGVFLPNYNPNDMSTPTNRMNTQSPPTTLSEERLDQWSDDDKKELARIEAQSKEEAFTEMSANSVDVAAFTERVNQIVDAGVTKHSIYCEITRSDGSVHMLPDPVKVGDVEWQLRYGKPESVRWQAASVIGFYRTFFSLPYKSRLEVMSKILAASSTGKEGGV